MKAIEAPIQQPMAVCNNIISMIYDHMLSPLVANHIRAVCVSRPAVTRGHFNVMSYGISTQGNIPTNTSIMYM